MSEVDIIYSLALIVFCLINYKVYIYNKCIKKKNSDNKIEIISGIPRSPTKLKFDNDMLEEGIPFKTSEDSECPYCFCKIKVIDKKNNFTVEFRANDNRICSSCYNKLSNKNSGFF